jgi:hypothetical protein
MKNIIFTFILIIFITGNTYSTPVFNFLKDVSNARAAGLAGTYLCVENDLQGVFFNPATLSTVEKNNFSFTFFKHALDINSGNVSYIIPYKFEDGVLSVNAVYTNYGSFDYLDKTGSNFGTFSANDFAFSVNYSNLLDTNFYYGVGLKYINSNIEKYASSALAIDFGLFYKLKDNRSNLGLSILNAGFQLSSFDGKSEDLPLDVRIGFNHHLKGLPLLFNLSFNHLADKTNSFGDKFKNISIGGEIYISQYVDLRLGFDNHIRSVLTNDLDKGLSGFSAGLGIKTEPFNFDYSVSIYNDAVNLHRFTILLNL